MEHISSRQNPLARQLRELARGAGAGGEALLEGAHLLQEAWSSGTTVDVAIFSDAARSPELEALAHQAVRHGTRLVSMPPALFESISPVRHPAGVVAIARLRRAALQSVVTRAPRQVLLLDRVQDPGNVGAIIRAAEAFGASGIIAGPGTADPFGWRALRGAMGSTFRVPIAAAELADAIDAARDAGVRIIATVPRGGAAPRALDLAGPWMLVLGGEGPGLPADVMAAADERLSIEMQPPVESLNVAVAAALIAYESSRQKSDVSVR